MKVSELIQKERALLKDKSPKEKLRHIWLYYKWHMGAVFLAVCYIISTVGSNAESHHVVLNSTFLNTTAYSSDALDFEQDFMARCQLDSHEQLVIFDTSLHYDPDPDPEDGTTAYETLQLLITRAHTGDMDVLVTDSAPVNLLIYGEFFIDLSQALTKEQLDAYRPYFLYMDNAFLQQITSADLSTLDPDMVITYPDPTRPELMQEPIPVLIDISGSDKIKNLYPNVADRLTLGFVTNSQHPEMAQLFLDYLMK